jgi:hypothetical protein
MPTQKPQKKTRRDFLKTSSAAVSAVAVGSLSINRGAHAAGDDMIRIGVIGCGSRGPGAAVNAMNVDPGVRMYAFCRTQYGCYDEYSSLLFGTKGRCHLMQCRIEGETNWRYDAKRGEEEPHQAEHRPLFAAIRSGNLLNAGDYMTRSTMVAVMGQLTCYSGKEVTWDQMMKSDYVHLPRPEDVSLDMEPPVKPDANGEYPVFARPGMT